MNNRTRALPRVCLTVNIGVRGSMLTCIQSRGGPIRITNEDNSGGVGEGNGRGGGSTELEEILSTDGWVGRRCCDRWKMVLETPLVAPQRWFLLMHCCSGIITAKQQQQQRNHGRIHSCAQTFGHNTFFYWGLLGCQALHLLEYLLIREGKGVQVVSCHVQDGAPSHVFSELSERQPLTEYLPDSRRTPVQRAGRVHHNT